MTGEHVDVLIVGAGLSGVGMAAQLTRRCPGRSFLLLERREAMGGTWDYFRYPGIRCDSDMHTLGYSFRPWPRDEVITDADSIRSYIEETAAEYGVSEHVRFGHRVTAARWSSHDARWTVEAEVESSGERLTFTASFLVSCSGYYSYDEAHVPTFEGRDDFAGDVVHAQFWDEDYDYEGKRVVVVGSGATAVTVVPAMTERAAHVTMLQRSPTYMMTVPKYDRVVRALKKVLSDQAVATLIRTRNTSMMFGFYKLARHRPKLARRMLLRGVEKQLASHVDMKHFTPHYAPWDERICAVPEGDLFEALNDGRASVVTDHIERFERDGIRLRSGELLEADLVVLATGLKLQMFGGVEVEVDGKPHRGVDALTYRATMLADIPNFAMVFGYVNVSWTRKADLVAEFVCRLLNHMKAKGHDEVTPRGSEGFETEEPFVALKSGYIRRGNRVMPKQGSGAPWRNTQNVFLDTLLLRYAPLDDGYLKFRGAAARRSHARGEPGTLRKGHRAAVPV